MLLELVGINTLLTGLIVEEQALRHLYCRYLMPLDKITSLVFAVTAHSSFKGADCMFPQLCYQCGQGT